MTTQENKIVKQSTVGPLLVDKVYEAQYQKEGTLTAQLKQTIETKSLYPSKSVTSNMQDNPFAQEDFGFTPQEYNSSETRVAWIPVPAGSTVESVTAQLEKIAGRTIQRVLANRPILSDNQKYAIGAGQTTEDIIAASQVLRFPDNHETTPNKLILDKNGKIQYKANFFRNTKVEDLDYRTEAKDDFYASKELLEELNAGIATNSHVGQQSTL